MRLIHIGIACLFVLLALSCSSKQPVPPARSENISIGSYDQPVIAPSPDPQVKNTPDKTTPDKTIRYILPGDLSNSGIIVCDNGSISNSEQESCFLRLDIDKAIGTNKYTYNCIVSPESIHTTATLGWDIRVAECPGNGEQYVFFHSDETTIDGKNAVIQIPVVVNSSAPLGRYLFKLVFYNK